MTVEISNEDSILVSVKKLLGIEEDCTDFDMDILIHIDSVFFELQQLGVGPEEGFQALSADTTWLDYIQDTKLLGIIKSLMYLKVRILFDPPSGSELESFNRIIERFEWRLMTEVELSKSNSEEVQNGS